MVIKAEPAFTWFYSCNKTPRGNAPSIACTGCGLLPPPPLGSPLLHSKFLSSKEDIQMANKHMKRCSPSLTIRKMQTKTTRRYHLTLVRLTAVQKSTSHKCWRGCREGNSLALLVGMQTSTATIENSVEIP